MAKKKTNVADYNFDTIVIGSGPAGSTAAEILAHGGQRVAIVEAEKLGGECLNYGCVPTKSMLAASHLFRSVKNQKAITNSGLLKLRINKLISLAENNIAKTGADELDVQFKKLGITTLNGRAYFLDSRYIDVGGEKISAHNYIIATGGEVAIPNIPGLDGLDYLTYKNFLARVKDKAPRSVTIIGGGAVGCEYAQILSAVGIKVNIVECAPRLVADQEPEASAVLLESFKKSGIKVYLSTRVVSAHPSSTGNLKEVEIFCPQDGQVNLKTEAIMIATGKKMREGGDGLGNAGIHCQDGLIKTDPHCRTNQDHIYAIGDTAGPYRLTSTALQQARIAALNILSPIKKNLATIDHEVTPSCIFTLPEIAKVGESTASLRARKHAIVQSIVPLSEVTRSRLEDDLGGFVKLWADNSTKHILGACLVGPNSAEQIASIALAIKFNITAHQLADLTQIFPSWSEAISLAASEL